MTIDSKKNSCIPFYERLVHIGFDFGLIVKDDFLIRTSFGKENGIIRAASNVLSNRQNLNIPYFEHFSKKNRKQNPVSISVQDTLQEGGYLYFTPSAGTRPETSLRGPMDLMSLASRMLTKVFRFFTGKTDHSELESYFITSNFREFSFNEVYKIKSVEYIKDFHDYAVVLEELEDGTIFILNPSAFGKTDSIFISE